jgi:hypothetical protein
VAERFEPFHSLGRLGMNFLGNSFTIDELHGF